MARDGHRVARAHKVLLDIDRVELPVELLLDLLVAVRDQARVS